MNSLGEARFGGTDLTLHPLCVGPSRWLKCLGGGERPCVGCTEIDIAATSRNDVAAARQVLAACAG